METVEITSRKGKGITIKHLPVEMLEKILEKLDIEDLKTCTRVCLLWSRIAQDISVNKMKKACKIVLGAHRYMDAKLRTSLSWEQMYKSLCLWKEVRSLRVSIRSTSPLHTEFACISDEKYVPRMQFLENEIVAFPLFIKKNQPQEDFLINWGFYNAINYYDLTTLELKNTQIFDFAFCMYAENDFMIVFVTKAHMLRVCTKKDQQFRNFGKLPIDENVYLMGKKILFKTPNGLIKMINLVVENDEVMLKSRDIPKESFSGQEIKAVTSINESRVNLITQKGCIFAVINQSDNEYKVHHIRNINKNNIKDVDFLDTLKIHGFDWSALDVYKWITEDYDKKWLFDTGLNNSNTVKAHGDVLLIGTTRRVLEIYVDPYTNGMLKLQVEKPLQRIIVPRHVARMSETPPPPNGIVQIEVVQILDGHRIIMLYDRQIVVVDFKKVPKRHTSVMADSSKRRQRCGNCNECGQRLHAALTLHCAELQAHNASLPLHHIALRLNQAALWGHHAAMWRHLNARPLHDALIELLYAPHAPQIDTVEWEVVPLARVINHRGWQVAPLAQQNDPLEWQVIPLARQIESLARPFERLRWQVAPLAQQVTVARPRASLPGSHAPLCIEYPEDPADQNIIIACDK